jgi:hypothetical protein
MTTPNNTASDPGEMPPHLQEAAKQRDEKRKAELSQLATKASEAHSIVVNAPKVVLQHAITAGAVLNEAKSKVGHGNWLAWLKENCLDISDRTAERYMKLADGKAKLDKKLQDPDKFDIVSNLTINEALRLIDEPDGEQSASAEAKKTGDAVSSSPSSSSKSKNKKKQTEPTTKERKEQIDGFKSEWLNLSDWQKNYFVKTYQHEIREILDGIEGLAGMEEEEAEDQLALS